MEKRSLEQEDRRKGGCLRQAISLGGESAAGAGGGGRYESPELRRMELREDRSKELPREKQRA